MRRIILAPALLAGLSAGYSSDKNPPYKPASIGYRRGFVEHGKYLVNCTAAEAKAFTDAPASGSEEERQRATASLQCRQLCEEQFDPYTPLYKFDVESRSERIAAACEFPVDLVYDRMFTTANSDRLIADPNGYFFEDPSLDLLYADSDESSDGEETAAVVARAAPGLAADDIYVPPAPPGVNVTAYDFAAVRKEIEQRAGFGLNLANLPPQVEQLDRDLAELNFTFYFDLSAVPQLAAEGDSTSSTTTPKPADTGETAPTAFPTVSPPELPEYFYYALGSGVIDFPQLASCAFEGGATTARRLYQLKLFPESLVIYDNVTDFHHTYRPDDFPLEDNTVDQTVDPVTQEPVAWPTRRRVMMKLDTQPSSFPQAFAEQFEWNRQAWKVGNLSSNVCVQVYGLAPLRARVADVKISTRLSLYKLETGTTLGSNELLLASDYDSTVSEGKVNCDACAKLGGVFCSATKGVQKIQSYFDPQYASLDPSSEEFRLEFPPRERCITNPLTCAGSLVRCKNGKNREATDFLGLI